jgi:aminopeptidase N
MPQVHADSSNVSAADESDEHQTFQFQDTPSIPSYLLAFAAGTVSHQLLL